MTPQEIEDRAFADPSSIPDGLAELERQAEQAGGDLVKLNPIIDATRTLRRLQPAS